MFGGFPQEYQHIASGIAGEDGLNVLPGTVQFMNIDPSEPKHEQLYNAIVQRIQVSVPGAQVHSIVRQLFADGYAKFREEASARICDTAMGFTSSPGALVTHHELRFMGAGHNVKRRRASGQGHLHPSPEPPIFVSTHAMYPLFVHTAERDSEGHMFCAFGEFLLPEDGSTPHLQTPPVTDLTHNFDAKPGYRKVFGDMGRDFFYGHYMVRSLTHFYAHYVIRVKFPMVHFGMDVRLTHCKTGMDLAHFHNCFHTPSTALEDDRIGVHVPGDHPFAGSGAWKQNCLMTLRSGSGDWFRILRTNETAHQNHDAVKYGDHMLIMHVPTGLFLGVLDAESQPFLNFDQPNDERQRQVSLLPGTFQPSWKADRLHWVMSWEESQDSLPVCFFPCQKASIFLTNPATKLKLHSHELPLFGMDGHEVTGFHVNRDPFNAWAISGIRAENPFLAGLLPLSGLPFVGRATPDTTHAIAQEDQAFENARKRRLSHPQNIQDLGRSGAST